MKRWIGIFLLTFTSISHANDCLVRQNSPQLTPDETEQLLVTPTTSTMNGETRKLFHFKNGSLLIAQWNECELGISFLLLSLDNKANTEMRIKNALWLDSLFRNSNSSQTQISAAIKQNPNTYSLSISQTNGAIIELHWENLVSEDMAPASMFSSSASYRWFGPEGM
ncbi:hypothetical protein [Agarivorans sp. JK6]|uniref:hypothetical protein n=1 Tax=Agarivorans sp. JK6 TaxID=2997426 RepID=UPI0038732047